MNLKRASSTLDWLLPFCLLSFMGSYIIFLNRIFTNNVRWGVFSALFVYLIMKRNILRFLDVPLAVALISYLGWCFFTSFWSNVPILSFMKTIVLAFVVIGLISAGTEWMKTHVWKEALNYLSFLAYLFMLTAFLGKAQNPLDVYVKLNSGLSNFRGFVTGANMLGFMMAIAFPFFLWKISYEWHNIKKRILYFFLLISCLYFLTISIARSSIVMVLIISLSLMMSLSLTKKSMLIFFGLFITAIIFIASPSSITDMSQSATKYLYKYGNGSKMFGSRQILWERGVEGAEAGNWMGLGYGASLGQTDFHFDNGLSASTEKGSSQLAILEETGIIGFVLYLLMLLIILVKLFKMHITASDQHSKILVGILIGMFVGMIFESIFEGWWDSPGAPESVYFWVLIGIIRGLEIVMQGKKTYATCQNETNVRNNLASPI